MTANHVLLAVEILLGAKTLDDLGRPQSPMISRVTGAGSGATADVRELAQRWYSRLASDPMGDLDDELLANFVAEAKALSG